MTTLARALLRATDLRELDISDNSCDEETATALAAALAQQPRLARLVLADLNMGDSSLAIIIDALLASRAPLAELCLSGNELTAEGARDIVRLLTADHSRLSILDVSINNLGDEGVSIIADAVANTTSQTALAKLNVADNEITSLAAVHLASRLVHSPGVMELDFSQNEDVSPAVSKRIAAIFPPTVVVLEDDDDNDYRSNPQTGDGNEEDDADAETDVGDDPVDEDDTRQAYQQSRSAQQVESALQALEKSVRSERGETVEPASPRSQSEVSRLVNFFSDPDDKMKTDNEIGNGTGITNDEAASSSIANVGATTHGTTTATSTSDAEHRVPATPPPSRFLSGITSPITPPPSSSSVHTRGQAASSSGQTVEGDNMDAVNDDDVDMEGVGVGEGDDYGDGDGEGDDGNVILSARKLKESIVSLSKEISDVAGELELPVSPSLQPRNLDPGIMAAGDDANGENDPFILRRDDNATAARTATASASMVATANQALVITAAGAAARSKALATDVRPKMSPVTIAVDCAGGCLVALFVIVIVLAIAQSQEESTFSFRPL